MHTARNTLATTIMQDNGVPVETVSKMLALSPTQEQFERS